MQTSSCHYGNCRHVYHHATTFFPCWWSAINFAPGGDVSSALPLPAIPSVGAAKSFRAKGANPALQVWFTCALNSSVHVLM